MSEIEFIISLEAGDSNERLHVFWKVRGGTEEYYLDGTERTVDMLLQEFWEEFNENVVVDDVVDIDWIAWFENELVENNVDDEDEAEVEWGGNEANVEADVGFYDGDAAISP